MRLFSFKRNMEEKFSFYFSLTSLMMLFPPCRHSEAGTGLTTAGVPKHRSHSARFRNLARPQGWPRESASPLIGQPWRATTSSWVGRGGWSGMVLLLVNLCHCCLNSASITIIVMLEVRAVPIYRLCSFLEHSSKRI